MLVLVTRPAQQAREWVDGLRAAALQAEALPLIAIEGPADAAPVRAAWAGLPGRAMAVFVSPNAVARFFACRPEGTPWPGGTLAASPGPGTSLALLREGVPAGQIVEPPADARQFDSESLWQELAGRDWRGSQVLIVRGNDGRDWLAERLRECGAGVDFVATYRRTAPTLSEGEQQLLAAALAGPGRHLWFFSSSEAIRHLGSLARGADWSRAVALATHPRIAEAAHRLGLARVVESQPSLAAVVACIQSIAS
jgi:uroporphyrinogen-III synthase